MTKGFAKCFFVVSPSDFVTTSDVKCLYKICVPTAFRFKTDEGGGARSFWRSVKVGLAETTSRELEIDVGKECIQGIR
jgi:hypothetical protein